MLSRHQPTSGQGTYPRLNCVLQSVDFFLKQQTWKLLERAAGVGGGQDARPAPSRGVSTGKISDDNRYSYAVASHVYIDSNHGSDLPQLNLPTNFQWTFIKRKRRLCNTSRQDRMFSKPIWCGVGHQLCSAAPQPVRGVYTRLLRPTPRNLHRSTYTLLPRQTEESTGLVLISTCRSAC